MGFHNQIWVKILIVVILVLVASSTAAYVVRTGKNKPNPFSQLTPLLSAPPSTRFSTTLVQPSLTSIMQERRDTTTRWKTYTNAKGGYSIEYPSSWTTEEDKQIGSTPVEVPIFKAAPPENIKYELPYFLVISVEDDPQNLSIDDYNKNIYRFDFKYLTVSLKDHIEGKKTVDKPGAIGYEDIFIKRGLKIYDISLGKGSGEEIDNNTFNLILSTFKFTQ